MFGLGEKKITKQAIQDDLVEELIKLESDNHRMIRYIIDKLKWLKEDKDVNDIVGPFIGMIDRNIMNQMQEISKINVCSVMELGDVFECCVMSFYGVKVQGCTKDGKTTEWCTIPINSVGDGCLASAFAVKRRQNLFRLTQSIAEFVQSEIERLLYQYNLSIPIGLIEKKPEDLFLLPDEGCDKNATPQPKRT